jgi:hypothetical protein
MHLEFTKGANACESQQIFSKKISMGQNFMLIPNSRNELKNVFL